MTSSPPSITIVDDPSELCGYQPYIRKNSRKSKNTRALQKCSICHCHMLHIQLAQVCGHRFHTRCINRWLTRGKDTCPMCRRVISEHSESVSGQ